MEYYLTILIKLILSAALGALIGFEREHKNRPAGLRTNVLVCIGAALVQIISIDVFNEYRGITNLDPARLGAQVISGIGFLGAGTIMREGASVKGLTTAAGLWVVACIGLAIGSGSYVPGIIAAVLAYLTLRTLKGLEAKVSKRSSYFDVELQIENKPGQIGKIGQVLGGMNVNIRNIEFKNYEGEIITAYLNLVISTSISKKDIIRRLLMEEGVISVEEK